MEARIGNMESKLTEVDEKIDRVMDALARIEATMSTIPGKEPAAGTR